MLWDDVKACFDTDDGTLPGVEISNLSPLGVSAVYNMLRRRSRPVGGPPSSGTPCFGNLFQSSQSRTRRNWSLPERL